MEKRRWSYSVEGTADEISALTGRLGNINGVRVKSALTGKNRQRGMKSLIKQSNGSRVRRSCLRGLTLSVCG